jgi:competence protein ComEA
MRSLSAQERGLLILIAAGLVAAGIAMTLRVERPQPVVDVGPITLSDVRIVVPTFRSGSSLINVNTATAEELTRLPGIGDALATRIIIYRADHGPFASIDELAEVNGIGPQTVDRLRDRATVE